MNCPKCGKSMAKVSEKGEGNGPNGGWLGVYEDMRGSLPLYDGDIEMWKCECGVMVYISEQTG